MITLPIPKWSIGEATGTLFRDGSPTGTEIRQLNPWGGTAHDAIAQANLVPALVAALEACGQTFQKLEDDHYSDEGSGQWATYQDGKEIVAKALAKVQT